jgi:hypothetical protein
MGTTLVSALFGAICFYLASWKSAGGTEKKE